MTKDVIALDGERIHTNPNLVYLLLNKPMGCVTTASDPEAVQALRDHSVRLFADLVRHRKRGLDLVYEAYHVDIGGES